MSAGNLSVAGSDAPVNKPGEGGQVFRRDSILMMVNNALVNFTFHRNVRGGDTGRGRVEHRSILQLSVTHHTCTM